MTQPTPFPAAIEAEQSVIGALLRDNDAVDRIGDLRPEHFYQGDHAVIFRELMRHLAAGRSCDVISLGDALRGKVDDCLGYLNSMAQNTPSAANVGRYAAIVRDKAVKRGLIKLGREIADAAGTSHEDAAVMVDQASSALEQLAQARTKSEPVRAGDELVAHVQQIERRIAGIESTVISTGFPDLDRKLSGGIRGGQLIVVAARPKMGKTGFAMNVACNVAEHHGVLVLSMEMPKAQIHDRNLASLGRVPLERLNEPHMLTHEDWDGISRAATKLDTMSLYLDEEGGLRLLDVRMKAKIVKRKRGLKLLVVDYLQLMNGDGDNRNTQIEGITRGLKALAKELDIGILLLSQLNRQLEARPNKRPMPSDLRDSGAIEQDADAVIFLYRDEVYNSDSLDVGVCEVDVALCRQGAPGRVALAYIGEHTRFENLTRQWQPPRPREKRRIGGLSDFL
jgi:replicative DNA helicase